MCKKIAVALAALILPALLWPPALQAQAATFEDLAQLSKKDLQEIAKQTKLDDVWKQFSDKLKKPVDWQKEWDKLSHDDEQYEEDYEPKGMPKVPSKCAESDECRSCFEPAYERLTAVRIRFEKLRRIYAWTANYKARAFALGDSAAGMHGLAGLAWVGERVKLERQFGQFEASYDAKYEELIAELRAALEQIAACEEQVYGEQDWYNRFGFIYYQFMADRYRR
jgi:hypothetical protein